MKKILFYRKELNMLKILFLFFAFFLTIQPNAQTSSWYVLPGAPNLDTLSPKRFDDIYFINSQTGWVIKGDRYYVNNDTGSVYRTTNGGNNWVVVNNQIRNYLRCTGFFNENIGIIGAIGDTLHTLYRTTDGGFTWADIMPSIQGTAPGGICGISIVNSNIAYACGRYYCPANVIKTTNAGLNWISLPVDTSLVRLLVDCHFWSADSGFVVGGYSTNNTNSLSRSVILFTSNGGANWVRVYQSSRINEWCWKIQFVNRQLGFTSIERYTYPTFILKTTNGGMNWLEISLPNNITNLEAIGFVNEQTGWVGGWGQSYNEPNYETTNGGISWHLAGWGKNMNRIRFLSDTLAFAVGTTVYKFTSEPIGIQQISAGIPSQYELFQNYPNPFNPVTQISFDLAEDGFISLKVYNVLGAEVTTLINKNIKAGSYSTVFEAALFSSGVYFYQLNAGGKSFTKKMVIIK